MAAIYSIAYFPNVAYISSMLSQEEVYIEKHENFIRQSYRSRCYLKGANGILPLVVPVVGARKKTLIKEVRVQNKEPWAREHLKSIQSAYGKSPFFEHYFESIEQMLRKDHVFLYDLCIESLTLCLELTRLKISWQETEAFAKTFTDPVNDLRNSFNAKKPGAFPEFFKPQPYLQIFGKQFVPNLSVLDLIFCEGPGASGILKASFKEF